MEKLNFKFISIVFLLLCFLVIYVFVQNDKKEEKIKQFFQSIEQFNPNSFIITYNGRGFEGVINKVYTKEIIVTDKLLMKKLINSLKYCTPLKLNGPRMYTVPRKMNQ